MQTYIDYLPIDVIRVYIMPHLNYQERIGLNMCIPVIDRIPHRMNKDSIEKHDHELRTLIVKKYLDRCFWLLGTERIENITALFKLLQQPHYFILLKRSTNFRNVATDKISYLIQGLIDFKETVELGVRLSLASELKKLRSMINTSGPYSDMNFNNIPLLSFQ